MRPKGCLSVRVEHADKTHDLELFVFEADGPPIIGREWLVDLPFIKQNEKGIMEINLLVSDSTFSKRISTYFSELFCDKVEKYN